MGEQKGSVFFGVGVRAGLVETDIDEFLRGKLLAEGQHLTFHHPAFFFFLPDHFPLPERPQLEIPPSDRHQISPPVEHCPRDALAHSVLGDTFLALPNKHASVVVAD